MIYKNIFSAAWIMQWKIKKGPDFRPFNFYGPAWIP